MTGNAMRIGILALQGAFIEHSRMLRRLGAETFEIRRREDVAEPMDGLVLPGGESTVMRKLLAETGLLLPLRDALANGMPAFGTCAGLILLAREIAGSGEAACFGVLDACVQRNAYGRQLGSFRVISHCSGIGDIPMVFIRAPYVVDAGEDVDVLAAVRGRIVAVRQRNILATAFHPELTDDLSVHDYFLSMTRSVAAAPRLFA